MMYFLEPEFWSNPWLIAALFASLTLVIYTRYALTSIAYKMFLEHWTATKRNSIAAKRKQIFRELRWASSSAIVFTLLCMLSLLLYHKGWTMLYSDWNTFPLWYFFASIVVVLLAYETYYYWLHRWMHKPAIFRVIHRIHHESLEPTVFTSFSFHPLEALLQFIFFPVLIVLMPLHLYALGIVFTIFTVSAMVNHSGVEVYGTRAVLKYFIGASHHDAHHLEFKSNFGLNMTLWDNLMRTTSKSKPHIQKRH